MARRTREVRSELQWRVLLARWLRSGRTVHEFCQAEDICEQTFYVWRRKLEQVERPRPTFLPVHVIPQRAEESQASGIEVVLANGRCLRVAPGFDPQTLVQVVDLLETGGSSC